MCISQGVRIGLGLGRVRRRISLHRGPGTNFSFLFPLPFLFLTPSPNALHLVAFTSWLPVQRSPEERLPTATEPSGQWSVVKRVLMAGLLFSVLLGFSVLLVYIFRSCGPRKHDPGSAQPSQPFLIGGSLCLPDIPEAWCLGLTHHLPCLTHSSLPTSQLLPPHLLLVLASSQGPSPLSSPGIPLPSPLGEPGPFLFPSSPSPSSERFPAGPCTTPVCWDLLARYLASGNTSVAPCTDFFSFACGQAKGTDHSFQALAEENKSRLRRILGEALWASGWL